MRKIINFNDNWNLFKKTLDLLMLCRQTGKQVNLPHTWNAVDGHDGNGSYDRGNYWYAKTLKLQRKRLVVLKYL